MRDGPHTLCREAIIWALLTPAQRRWLGELREAGAHWVEIRSGYGAMANRLAAACLCDLKPSPGRRLAMITPLGDAVLRWGNFIR